MPQEAPDFIDRLDALVKHGRPTTRAFRTFVRTFYREHGRKLPWRETRSAYRILVSEVMLQQTQADRVIPKYREFLRRFPNWSALAEARTAEVMRAWQGLGYYRRAFNLQRAAQAVVRDFGGKLPQDPAVIRSLPGVGSYTTGALCAFAFDVALPIIETNVRSVFLYTFFPKRKAVPDSEIFQLVEETLDRRNPRDWYYALMDLGSELKRHRRGINARSKHHAKQSPYEGSNRQARAAVLKTLAERGSATEAEIARVVSAERARIKRAVAGLLKEGLVRRSKGARLALP